MAEQRIQKVLADQGICSRREAERLIAAGKVKVNGHPVTLGDKMDPDYDKVMIDGFIKLGMGAKKVTPVPW